MQQHGVQETVQDAGGTVHTVEDDEEDCISIGDWSQAFMQALAFDEDLPPKFVSYRPYKGAKLRIFKLLGSLYGMSQAPMDWYKTLHGWMEQIGFIRSENDKAVWYHPSGLRVGSHVDDCIARGKRKLHKWFWAEAAKRFKIKQWGFVEVDQPQMFCSKLIQKCVDSEGVHWYSISLQIRTRHRGRLGPPRGSSTPDSVRASHLDVLMDRSPL